MKFFTVGQLEIILTINFEVIITKIKFLLYMITIIK